MSKLKMNCSYCGRKCSLEKDFCIPQDSVYVCKSCYEWQSKLAEKEKEKEIEEINREFVQSIHDWKEIIEKKDQAKIDFAIEQLEKVKEFLKDRIKIIEGDECIYDIDEIVGASCENKKTLEILDQQIKELKEKNV